MADFDLRNYDTDITNEQFAAMSPEEQQALINAISDSQAAAAETSSAADAATSGGMAPRSPPPGPQPSQRPANPNAITPDAFASYMQQARAHTAGINNMPYIFNPQNLIGTTPDQVKQSMYPGFTPGQSPLGAMLGVGGGPVGGMYDSNGNYISPAMTAGKGATTQTQTISNPLFSNIR